MKQKKIYLEIIRIFAIFFVIYTHTGTDAAAYYQVADHSFSYMLSLILFCVSQTCVPLFFLVSGATLLHKKESLTTVLKHRALRIFLIILLFGFIQYAYCYYLNPAIGFSLGSYFKVIYSSTVITQYWYLYAYFAFTLMLPFLRMLAQSMENIHFWYLFGLFFLLEAILPIAEYLWGTNRIALSVPLFEQSLLYPLLGYYIAQRSNQLFYTKKNLLLTNLLGLCALFSNTAVALMAHKQRGAAGGLIGLTVTVALVTFINIRAFCNYAQRSTLQIFHGKLSQLTCKLIFNIGGCVFGIYLLEPPLRDTFRFIYLALVPYLSWFFAVCVWIGTAIFCGAILFSILRKIPLLNKIL